MLKLGSNLFMEIKKIINHLDFNSGPAIDLKNSQQVFFYLLLILQIHILNGIQTQKQPNLHEFESK